MPSEMKASALLLRKQGTSMLNIPESQVPGDIQCQSFIYVDIAQMCAIRGHLQECFQTTFL